MKATNYLLDFGKKKKKKKKGYCKSIFCFLAEDSDSEECYHHNDCLEIKDEFKDLGLGIED